MLTKNQKIKSLPIVASGLMPAIISIKGGGAGRSRLLAALGLEQNSQPPVSWHVIENATAVNGGINSPYRVRFLHDFPVNESGNAAPTTALAGPENGSVFFRMVEIKFSHDSSADPESPKKYSWNQPSNGNRNRKTSKQSLMPPSQIISP